MSLFALRYLATFMLLAVSMAANAFVYAPTVSPSTPIAGQQIFVNIRAGDCDGFHFGEPGLPSVTRDGNRIRVLVAAFHTDYEPYCNAPAYELRTPIGTLPPGNYVFQVDRVYEDLLAPMVVETLGTIAVSVASPAAVPAISPPVATSCGLALICLAWISLRKSTSSRAPRYFKRSAATPICCSLFALLSPCTTWAVVYPPSLTPAHPSAKDTLFLEIGAEDCDGFYSNMPGYPQITRNGNTVRVLMRGSRAPDGPFCNVPFNVVRVPLGTFPPGKYQITVDSLVNEWLTGDSLEPLGELNLDVVAPASIPTLSMAGLGLLVISVSFIGALFLPGGRRIFLALLAIGATPSAKAESVERTIAVLLSDDPQAPTAQQVVGYFSFSPPPPGAPPLAAFVSVSPQSANYLLARRATGHFADYLSENSTTARAKLERYVLIRYEDDQDMQAAMASLTSDTAVVAAFPEQLLELSSSSSTISSMPGETSSASYNREALNIDAAWKWAGGYALVGAADTGLYTAHAQLRQFSAAGQYLGGNFVPAASLDVGLWPHGFDTNVDEQQPETIIPFSQCSPNGQTAMPPSVAGHGTHIAGLISASASSNDQPAGACKHCGIAMWKITHGECENGLFRPEFTLDATAGAITMMSDSGVQAINMSFGGIMTPADYCPLYPDYPLCLAITHASARDSALVASSGNSRSRIEFPASDSRVISVGGFDTSLSLWNDSPGNTVYCPFAPKPYECGSNFTINLGESKQELVAAAKNVLSTIYPSIDWNAKIGCGDSFGFGNVVNDGVGYCTGTSMSAPQVSGIVGILRSINPLVRTGKPIPAQGELAGIRTVLAQTTIEAQKQQGWSQTVGYGRPDASAAVERMLGKVEGSTVRNRVTPLFRFYGANSKDHLETTSPQMAISFLINQDDDYQPQGALIPGYPAFPNDPNSLALPAPRASAFVLSTEYSPLPRSPNLVPLYLIERSRPLPVGCTPGAQGCNKDNRDFTLVTTTPEIEATHADGYSLRTIQGYIYSPCTPEPTCIPPGAQAMYRECRLPDDDCATFLESERAGYEAAGYIAAYPTGANKKMGYAYPSIDTDGDGLIDGFERVIGTRILVVDSDGDGKSDRVEFPMAEVSTRDPCGPPNGGSCPADVIFADGFQ